MRMLDAAPHVIIMADLCSNGQGIMFYYCDLFFRTLVFEAEERRPTRPLSGCRNGVIL